MLRVQREIVCAPKDEVGLVFIHLNDSNKATMIKDFGAIKRSVFTAYGSPSELSWTVRKIFKLRILCSAFAQPGKNEIGDGQDTHSWHPSFGSLCKNQCGYSIVSCKCMDNEIKAQTIH